MRISDWSSDVFSSDLAAAVADLRAPHAAGAVDQAAAVLVPHVDAVGTLGDGAVGLAKRRHGLPGMQEVVVVVGADGRRGIAQTARDRKSVGKGTSVSVRVGVGGPSMINNKINTTTLSSSKPTKTKT